MGKKEKHLLALDKYEHGVVIHALNEMRFLKLLKFRMP